MLTNDSDGALAVLIILQRQDPVGEKEVNVLCRRAIYRFVYLLVMDGERKGLAGVKR